MFKFKSELKLSHDSGRTVVDLGIYTRPGSLRGREGRATCYLSFINNQVMEETNPV